MTTFRSSPGQATDIKEFFRERVDLVDKWLDRLVPSTSEPPGEIHEAMRYSVFAGGKRLRPILALATGEVFGAAEEDLLPAACALEMIHTYSLIHDDLPSMDNDTLRRGRPTCHVVFGEAMAILAGDALLTRAFHTLAQHGAESDSVRLRVIQEVSEAAGTVRALIGGQVLDLQSEGRTVDGQTLETIHRAKTGALIRCSVRVGAIIGAASEEELVQLTLFGEKAGLAFQVADDLLDATASSEELGKTAGKDAREQKATYTTLYGVETTRRMVDELGREAIGAAALPGRDTARLSQIARFIVERTN
jgi:geranylgeranyl diphosphate synthase, type II